MPTSQQLMIWIQQNPSLAIVGLLAVCVISFFFDYKKFSDDFRQNQKQDG